MLNAIEVERGPKALALGLLERQQVGRVVAPSLDSAGALWRGTVVLGHDAAEAATGKPCTTNDRSSEGDEGCSAHH